MGQYAIRSYSGALELPKNTMLISYLFLYILSTTNIIALSILHIKHYQQLKDVKVVLKRDSSSC